MTSILRLSLIVYSLFINKAEQMADFSEEWLSKEDLDGKEEEPVKQQSRGRRNETNSQANNSRRNQEEEKKPAKGLNDSNWLDEKLDDDPPQKQPQVSRGAACSQQMSFILKGSGEELVPDKLDTSWGASEEKGEKGKQSRQSPQDSNQAPRRGNRDRAEPANFKKKAAYTQQVDSRPRNTYNNNSSGNAYNNNYNNRDGNYRGRGRGQNRTGGYRGYQPRDGQDDEGGRYQGGGGNNYYKKRDNVVYEEKRSEDQEGSRRGNRGNREYNNNNNYNRDYNNRNRDRQYDDYNSRGSGYNNRGGNRDYNTDRESNRDYRESNRDREYKEYDTGSQASKSYSQKNQEETISIVSKPQTKPTVVVVKEKQKEQPLIPKGRRCWPQSSIYILGCKFSVTYRPINEYRCKLLVIPYASLKLEYYPGNIINSSEVDYKARILAKGEQISSPGSVYLQKAVSVGTFTGIAFLKVDEKRISDSLKLGIKNLLNTIQRLQGSTSLDTILFPICQQLGNTESIVSAFLESLENYKKIKEIYITTNQSECFMQVMNIFIDEVKEMLEDNEILMT